MTSPAFAFAIDFTRDWINRCLFLLPCTISALGAAGIDHLPAVVGAVVVMKKNRVCVGSRKDLVRFLKTYPYKKS